MSGNENTTPSPLQVYIGLRLLKWLFMGIWWLIKLVIVIVYTPFWLLIFRHLFANPWYWLLPAQERYEKQAEWYENSAKKK